MGRLSDKIKIIYLLMVILFAMGVFTYLLDTWGIIKLEESIPWLKKDPPRVADSADNPTLIELERLKKERERLKDKETKLSERELALKTREAELTKREEKLQEGHRGLQQEIKKVQQQQAANLKRRNLIRDQAVRFGNMAPQDAVRIMAGLSNSDLVDVLREMERSAAEQGRQSIVPFLLTLLQPPERSQIISALMLDPRAGELPGGD